MSKKIERTSYRFWLVRLYDALYPSNHVLGTSASLDFKEIPEAVEASRAVREWVQVFVSGHTFQPPVPFLSDLLRVATLAHIFDNDAAPYYLHRGRFAMVQCPSQFERPGGGQVLHELVATFEGRSSSCLVAGILSIQ